LGEGSEFVVRLPVIPTAAPEPPSPAKQAGERTGSALRVLVVDDNVPSADTMAMLMKELGHDVRTAYDGPKSLETAIAYRPDVVLLDIGLPGMNGYDVAKRIRQEPDLQDIVLIAVTGYGQASDRQHSQAAGFDHHLVKPADITQVEQILATVSEDKTRPGGIDGNQFRSN
jgi:CheY-like chemotaxis protein